MALSNIVGLDHIVVVVRNLASAAEIWRGLGFTVSPRGTHSAHMGTGNHTIMFGDDYLELLGVLAPTERNAPTRALLEKREGVERAAFTTRDAAEGVRELKARGIEASGPIDFSRPVDLADGRETEARFQTYLWPLNERPGGMRIFACQHFTRDAVWLPHLQRHANTTERIVRLELVSGRPERSAADMARLIDQPAERLPDGAWRVASGGTRGVFEFMDRPTFERRHVGVALEHLPEDGAVGLVLAVADLAGAAKALGAYGIANGAKSMSVAPRHANGVLIRFTANAAA